MNTLPISPCSTVINQVSRRRAQDILRRIFADDARANFTAVEWDWLRHVCPQATTNTTLERALLAAGPAFDQCVGLLISEFYEPEPRASRLRPMILQTLASLEAPAPSREDDES